MINHDSFPSATQVSAAEAQTARPQDFDAIVGELLSEGEQLLPSLTDGIGVDSVLIGALERSATPVKEWLRHFNRFAILGMRDHERLFDHSRPITLPEGPDNLTQLGHPRPEDA